MTNNIVSRVLTGLVLVAAATVARAAPVEFDGRFYEVVIANGITWQNAQTLANAATYEGIEGHLATINSPEEDEFVFGLTVGIGELWIGGSQVACVPAAVGCGWAWRNVSGEDIGEPIAATNTLPPFSTSNPYTNWQPGEPNDYPSGAFDETNLGIGRGGIRGWNDEGYLSNIRGYVIEYGDRLAPFPAGNCKSGPCNLTGGGVDGTVIQLPGTAVVPPNDLMSVRTWLITDSASRCAATNPQPLSLDLLDAAGAPGTDGVPDVEIPAYLCTHPLNNRFIAIKTSSGVQIPSGVVAITNDTTALLDPAYDCNAPIPTGESPLTQDVVVFQYDNQNKMLEFGYSSIRDPAFDGTVIESTNGCINPSRGSGGQGSFIFVGLSIHQGAALTAQQRLVDLLEHKLDLLGIAVGRARSQGAIKSGDYNKLSSAVNAANNHLQNGNYSEALVHVQKFQVATAATQFKPVASGTNWNGEFLMRINNIAFTLKVKVMRLAP